ncbi:zinc knuckle CX2CX4HX4C containing protein [Tanacetum coccineum]
MKSGFLDSGGRNNNHKKKKTNESVTVDNKETNIELNMEFPTMEVSVGKKANEPIDVTQVLVIGSVGSLNDVTSNVPNHVDYDHWLPLASVDEVNDRMKNYLYGYFIGKMLAFPVVEWFMRNNCEKYRLKKVTMVRGFYLCKFASINGVEYVLQNGPWMIHEILIFLNKWSPFVSLLKEELSHVPFWVKFHDVSLVAYTSNGLSLMDTKTGTPMMLDLYTNSMCLESWGQISYARILIEINACNEFSDHLVMCYHGTLGPPGILGYNKESPRNKGNTFSLTNSFDALNDENLIIEEVAKGSKATTSGKLVFVDDDGKPLERIDYSDNLGSDNEVETVENEIASFLPSKSASVNMDGFKEAQLLSMAGIRALKSLTEETQERRAEDLALSINRRLCEPNLDEDEDEEEEEEHPAPADSVPPVHRMTARISIRDEPSISLPPREEVERLLALTTPPPSPLTPLSIIL